MDLIAIMAAVFLNLQTGCDALTANVIHLGERDYLIQTWSCPDKHQRPHLWRTWQRECHANTQQHYWGRPYFLEDQQTQLAFYVNQFGELQGGQGASIHDAYVPLCGS